MKFIIFALAAVLAFAVAEDCPCTLEYLPVCASNGKTYPNQCSMLCVKKKEPTLSLLYRGKCGFPIELETRDAKCSCAKDLNTLCGSNGVTYANPCHLRCAQKNDDSLTFYYPGNCGAPIYDCPCTRELNPVCGSNGYTYPNTCLFRCAKETYESISVVYRGECGNPRESRNLDCSCPFIYLPVCGSNDVTYDNKCLLECDEKYDSTLELVHYGHCE